MLEGWGSGVYLWEYCGKFRLWLDVIGFMVLLLFFDSVVLLVKKDIVIVVM